MIFLKTVTLFTVLSAFLIASAPTYEQVSFPQKVIIERMVNFLESEPGADSPEQLQAINYLRNNGGQCDGLSKFHVLCKAISDKPNPKNEPRDDYQFFQNSIELLMQRVPTISTNPLSPEECGNLRRFIGNVLYFQGYAHAFTNNAVCADCPNIDLAKAYEYLAGKNLVEMLKLTPFICDKEIFADRLRKILQPGVLILIGTTPVSDFAKAGHATSLYQSLSGEISFYEPNQGEKIYASTQPGAIDHLAKTIFGDLDLETDPMMQKSIMGLFFRKLHLRIYRFKDFSAALEEYGDLRLRSDEKNKMRSFLDKHPDLDTNQFYKDLLAAPVHRQDLLQEISEQIKRDEHYALQKRQVDPLAEPRFLTYLLSKIVKNL